MMGEAFTMRGISHGENPSRKLFLKIWVNTIRLQNLDQ
jgi:hypothetical protein